MIVGQKVVCIDGNFSPDVAALFVALPLDGVVYTIREVKVGQSPAGTKGEVCVYLKGLHNPKASEPPHHERGFNAERFRPLDEMADTDELLIAAGVLAPQPARTYSGKEHD